MAYRKGVMCVIYSGNYFLLLHRKLHWKGWEFVKGGSKGNEKPIDTLKREVKEETHLQIRKIKRLPVHGKFTYDKITQRQRKAEGFSYVLFSAEAENNKATISGREHDSYRWCIYKQALKLLTWPNQRGYLKTAAKYNKKI